MAALPLARRFDIESLDAPIEGERCKRDGERWMREREEGEPPILGSWAIEEEMAMREEGDMDLGVASPA